MITFTHETTRYTVKPENAQAIRALAAKPPKMKMPSSTRIQRGYPVFTPGMITAHYVQIFNGQFAGVQHKIKHDCANYYSAAPTLDVTQPEVFEELDADYIEPPAKIKPFKATAAQLRAALMGLIEAVENGGDTTGALIRAKAFM
jgi:hypothetical protein